MNWAQWTYDKLVGIPTIAALPQIGTKAPVLSGGSLTGRQEVDQFIVYRLGTGAALLRDDMRPVATEQLVQVWVYDAVGGYGRVNSLLSDIRDAFIGQIAEPGAVSCEWIGDSQELADEDLDRIVRNTSFRLIGAS